eukprot:g28027.t1
MGTVAKTVEEEFNIMSCPKFVKVERRGIKLKLLLDTKFFSPLVQSLPVYIHNSSDTLCQFQNFPVCRVRPPPLYMGMKSLLMSIPHQEGFRAVCFFLQQRPELSPSTTTLLHLAELILTVNNFSFNCSHFLQ